MALWYCRCGSIFEARDDFIVECPECGSQLYYSPSYGNFDGFMYEEKRKEEE